jgi:palmitoyl-[glycerolipid] 3-(E)-desaturase
LQSVHFDIVEVMSEIDQLNETVNEMMKQIKDCSMGDSNPMKGCSEAIEAVSKGAVVYHHRSKALLGILATLALLTFTTSPSLSYSLCCLALMFVLVDLYGAVLHIVLDHPAFVNYPIIGDGCLEFQWHHAIPQDIVRKPFYEACGDLNMVALLHLGWLASWNRGLSNNSANVMAGSKLLLAYVGQYAHRMAHTTDTKRPNWVKCLQNWGILVSPKLHRAHHTTYDDGFPILSGLTAPLVKFLNTNMPNRHIWFVLFFVMSLGDVWLAEKLLTGIFSTL